MSPHHDHRKHHKHHKHSPKETTDADPPATDAPKCQPDIAIPNDACTVNSCIREEAGSECCTVSCAKAESTIDEMDTDGGVGLVVAGHEDAACGKGIEEEVVVTKAPKGDGEEDAETGEGEKKREKIRK